jgi:hypothetical protein
LPANDVPRSATGVFVKAERIASRFVTPGFACRSARISRSVSVTAERIFLAVRFGSSSRRMRPLSDAADLLILLVGSCRS